MGYAILRIAKVKSLSAAHAILRHNSRKVEVITANPDIKNPKIIIPEVEENQKNWEIVLNDLENDIWNSNLIFQFPTYILT